MTEIESKFQSTTLRDETVDDIESIVDDTQHAGGSAVDDVYTKYQFHRKLPDLPIVQMKDHILQMIDKHSVLILEGATGCGKTTQVCTNFNRSDDKS